MAFLQPGAAGDIPDDPISGGDADAAADSNSNAMMGQEDDGEDDDDGGSSSGSSEDFALPSGDIVGEADSATSSDSCDTSSSAASTPDEIYDTSMEEMLEQG